MKCTSSLVLLMILCAVVPRCATNPSARQSPRGTVVWNKAALERGTITFVAEGSRPSVPAPLWWITTYSAPNTTDPDYLYSSSVCNYPYLDNPPCAQFSATNPGRVSARSRHAGGVNMALCDGAVRFASNTVDLTVRRAYGSIQGGGVTSLD